LPTINGKLKINDVFTQPVKQRAIELNIKSKATT